MKLLYVRTKDDLRLMGVHYEPREKDIAVLSIHGMSGNIMENYFGHVIGESLSKDGVGFIFSFAPGNGSLSWASTTLSINISI